VADANMEIIQKILFLAMNVFTVGINEKISGN
jgi:hypothetical protein